MYSSKKNFGNQDVYSNYSIYSSFCTFTFRYQNCQPPENLSKIYETCLDGLPKRISFMLSCFSLYKDFLLNHISISKLIASRFYYNSWNLCYFIVERRLHHLSSYDREIDEEHNSYEIVQLLKNDLMDGSAESDNNNQFVPVKNVTHRKTKKSLFATLIRRNNAKKSKVKITKKIETCSTINFETESASSEQEIAHLPLSESEQCYPRKDRNFNLLKKIIKRPKIYDEISTNAIGDKSAQTETCPLDFVPSTYLPKYNIKLISGIDELQDILQNLHHCEEHMTYLLKKYVEDKKFQKQLLEASVEYFALQFDSKSHVNSLADKLWYQQIEVSKIQDYNLQKKINVLVGANRQLQQQLENLNRYCEKFAAKSNIYPKRFLHMRSFGKIYARNLIDNNRRLHNKVKTLTQVISDFEEELQKLQHHKGVLEDEKRSLRSQLYNLEGDLEKEHADHQMEKSKMGLQLGHVNSLMSDSVDVIRYIFQDLHDFEVQIKDLAINLTWPNFQYHDGNVVEMLYKIRACLGELIPTMIGAYKQVAAIAKSVNQLRNTNARLQENLQKSTTELNNLSKKLETHTSSVEVKADTLDAHQDYSSLKQKLESANEQNKFLHEQLEDKGKMLTESKISVNEVWSQHQALLNQIDEIVQTVLSLGPNDLPKQFNSSQEKVDYLRVRSSQMVAERKHWTERCSALEDENQHLVETQEAYQQDLATLQDGLTIISAENENLKKQLVTEHLTVTTLQNERIKYLEEKNLLKTIFQYFKSEVSRMQQLEGAVADMSKETSRLSLIAEFNKQVGEQLKNEVEMKESTIVELRQSLEKLSHLQIDSDKEKMNLCAQLNEVASVKDKLSDCLELELKKNFHLDETKKKIETNSKSQLKLYEEMQRNERAALKELLKDFKSLIKQRDCLVSMQEESRKKYKELEKHYGELKMQYDEALKQIGIKNEEVNCMIEKLDLHEERYKQLEETNNSNNTKYEKNLRKIEKVLGQMKVEKGELESNNTSLKSNLEKMQTELDNLKEQKAVVDDKLKLKTTELASLQAELSKNRTDLQSLMQENAKIKLEMDYDKKIYNHQTNELKEAVSVYSSRENVYAESHNMVLNKEQQIHDLKKVIYEREVDIKQREHECGFLKKQNEDLNKILMGYENQLVVLQDVEIAKLKVEEEMRILQRDHQDTLANLEIAKLEIEKLKRELKEQVAKSKQEKSFYKSQRNEIILEYSEQKLNIEEEIDSISNQLSTVTDSLHKEKHRFEELTKSHEELEAKYHQLEQNNEAERNNRHETNKKLLEFEKLVEILATERDNLKQQVQVLLVEINDEKEASATVYNENNTMQNILQQGRLQYDKILNHKAALEEELNEVQSRMGALQASNNMCHNEIETMMNLLEEKTTEMKSSKATIESLKTELTETQRTLVELKEDYFKLQQQVTGLEFKNCELTLQLHETQGKLETEKNLFQEFQLKHSEFATATSDNGEFNQY